MVLDLGNVRRRGAVLRRQRSFSALAFVISILAGLPAMATEYPIAPGQKVIGELGPYNPLGAYALHLGWPTYLIHWHEQAGWGRAQCEPWVHQALSRGHRQAVRRGGGRYAGAHGRATGDPGVDR